MPTYTTHLNLTKPIKTETYDIAVQNGNMDALDTAVYDRLTESQVNVLVRNISTGVVDRPSYTDNGNGTVTLGNFTARIFSTTDFTGDINLYNIAGATLTPNDLIISYAVVDYNGGTPIVKIINNVGLITESSVIPVITFYRNGNTILPLSWDSLGLGLANKLNQRFVKTQRYAVESGIALSEYGTRNVAISEGAVWIGAVRNTKPAYASATKPMKYFYHVGGVWTSTTETQYNNTKYDNGTSVVTSHPNKYIVNWIYMGADETSNAYLVLHNTHYGTFSEATLAQPIESLPTEIATHGILVGQIIVLYNASTASGITSAFTKQFVGTSTTEHNNLTGLQGGSAGEYYHATSAELATLQTAVPNTITINSKALTSNIVLTASDVSAVPTTRTVNSKALSADISLTASDVGAEPTITKNTAFNKNYGTTATDVKMNGTQGVGSVDAIARIDHVHPVDTSREPAITKNTAFNVNFETTATNIKMDGSQSLGALSTVARADHVHPSDTTRATTTTYTANITTTWTGSSAPYSQAVTVTGITDIDTPIINIVLTGTYATDTAMKDEWAKIYRAVTSTNTITFYSTAVTTATVAIQVKVVR